MKTSSNFGQFLQCFALVSVVVFCSCADKGAESTQADLPGCDETYWLGVWGAAPTSAEEAYANQSLRLIAAPLRGGDTLRVVLTNRHSDDALELNSVWIGKQRKDAELIPDSNVPVLFQGQSKVIIPPGEDITSDAVEIRFSAFEKLAVSVDLSEKGGVLTEHNQAFDTSWVTASGNGGFAADETGAAFVNPIAARPLLIGLETQATREHSVIVTVGDSITDGFGSDVDETERYPDYLARRINQANLPFAVINMGIGGNRVLRDGLVPQMGPSLLSRLEADILSRDDVSHVILLEGINDLAIPPQPTGDDVISGITKAVQRLNERRQGLPDITVLLGTLTPVGGASGIAVLHETADDERRIVNAFIRSTDIADGYVDFDAAIRVQDPGIDDPVPMVTEYDSGDGLHPSSEGYQRMADAVDLDSLNRQVCRR